MSQRYSQPSIAGATRFSKSPMADVQFSRMKATPNWFTTYNAGDIVPVYYKEVLPHETMNLSVNYVNRLASAVIKPTMGTYQLDLFAFFVPNRIVNESWKNVQGENTSGIWAAPEVNLAPLYPVGRSGVKIPVGSVADYYGFPTQDTIRPEVLQQCNDLKFKGYLEVYNNFFRDQNYQPPINYSKLNVYQGFLETKGTKINLTNKTTEGTPTYISGSAGKADGSYPEGAVIEAVFGAGAGGRHDSSVIAARLTDWSALDRPLKANKLHDAFTSVLPAPQKGADVYFGVGQTAPVVIDAAAELSQYTNPLKLMTDGQGLQDGATLPLTVGTLSSNQGIVGADGSNPVSGTPLKIVGSNLKGFADLSTATGISVNDLRMAVATQAVYECLSRSGSRYLSTLRAFFEIEAENPFADIPTELGHIRKELDLYQVAQTSASQEGNTAQGDLAAFGYTASGGHLFTRTFLEHGYVHIFAIVRHRNVYSTYFAPDNFRKSTLDFYLPQFANIGEQPIRLSTLNPFVEDTQNAVLGYQEAWWEYRYEPDRVSGQFRTGLNNGLDIWTTADPYDSTFTHVNGEWLKSNSQEVLDRSLAVQSVDGNGNLLAHQYIAMFVFENDKQLPMPTYSVPGLDTI